MRRLFRRLLFSFQFMTRIPIPLALNVDESDMVGTLPFFPVVGAAIGLTGGLGVWGACALGSLNLAAGAAVLLPLALSGGLHLDGLADVCDAWFSGKDKERMLEIMKDSRVGAFGAMGIAFLLLAKFAVFSAAIELGGGVSPRTALALAVGTAVSGRLAMVTAAAISRPARMDGMGRSFILPANWKHLAAALAAALALCAPIAGGAWFLPLLVAPASGGWLARRFSRRLNGLTGDTLGAACELTELVTAGAFAVFFRLTAG